MLWILIVINADSDPSFYLNSEPDLYHYHGKQCCGSGFFYYQAKIVRKPFDSFCFVTYLWLFLNDANVGYLQKVISRKTFFDVLKDNDEKSRIRIHKSEARIRGQGPYQNVTDPQHWWRKAGNNFFLLILVNFLAPRSGSAFTIRI